MKPTKKYHFKFEPKNTFKIYCDPDNNFREILRFHGDGKVTCRRKTYNDMSEMARDVFGNCVWKLHTTPEQSSYIYSVCSDISAYFRPDLDFKFCPYCGRDVEVVKS